MPAAANAPARVGPPSSNTSTTPPAASRSSTSAASWVRMWSVSARVLDEAAETLRVVGSDVECLRRLVQHARGLRYAAGADDHAQRLPCGEAAVGVADGQPRVVGEHGAGA